MTEASNQPQTLCIKHLAKVYSKRWVVKDVSFSMQSGQIVGLLGPNGAGKTTSFYMVVGLVRMDKGEIHLDNEDISDLAMHQRARKGIGYLPQEASIFRKLTIAENIMAILETRKDLNKQQRQQRLKELLEDFKITHIKDSLGMSVSGGERAVRKLPVLWQQIQNLCCLMNLSLGSIQFLSEILKILFVSSKVVALVC